MTEKIDSAEKLDLLWDGIWQRLIRVIPSLLLSSLIAFLLFKFLSDKLGFGFLGVVTFGIIIMGMASVISITVGRGSKNRQFGSTLAVLIPSVVSLESAIQFEATIGSLIFITYMGGVFLGGFAYFFVDNMLLPLVNTENIKSEDVICIQISSSIADVARLIEEVLSSLYISRFKTSGADKEKQWRFNSRNYSQYCYLYARSEGDNSVDLAFLNFTEVPNELYRSEKHEKYLNFLRKTVDGYLRLNDIKCAPVQNPDLASKILEEATRRYKRARAGDWSRDLRKLVKTQFKLIISILISAIMVYTGRDVITQYYEQYPWIFIILAGPLMYPILNYVSKNLKEGVKK